MKTRHFTTFVIFSLLFTFLLIPFTSNASDTDNIPSIESLEEEYCYEVIIEDNATPRGPVLPGQQTTKTKTVNIKNSSGDILVSVSIKATFLYDGSSATCISCTPSAKAYHSAWSVKSVTSSKSGNSATAVATLIRTDSAGTTQQSTKSVTISCSPAGVVS